MSKDITEEILLNAGFHKEEIYSIVYPLSNYDKTKENS